MERLKNLFGRKEHTSQLEERKLLVEQNPSLVKKYHLFDKEVRPSKDVIYHPCGAFDISPSAAFPESRVIYVEQDEQAVKALKLRGFEAYKASALEFDPGEVNLLIMLNPVIAPNKPAQHVVKDGYVLSNDYHGTASFMKENRSFILEGILRQDKDKGMIYDRENPEDYWKEIDTEEEFKNNPISWTTASYSMAVSVVEAMTGKRENVFAEYKKIIELARDQNRRKDEELIAKNPHMAQILGNTDDKDILMFDHNDRQFVISTRFPRKKGASDDLFVFKRSECTEAMK